MNKAKTNFFLVYCISQKNQELCFCFSATLDAKLDEKVCCF
jgi:hypothetical protein